MAVYTKFLFIAVALICGVSAGLRSRDDGRAASSAAARWEGSAAPVQTELFPVGDFMYVLDFGYAVAIDGSTAVVGSPASFELQVNRRVDNGSAPLSAEDGINTGVAYIFSKLGGQWVQSANLSIVPCTQVDNFGSAVALTGDTLMIGAKGYCDFVGAAFVYTRSGDSWTPTSSVTFPDNYSRGQFGFSLAVSAVGVGIAGAPYTTADGNPLLGSAYIVARSSGGGWSQSQQLTPADTAGDNFGWSVAIAPAGNVALVGACKNTTKGTVYVFAPNATGVWVQTAALTASDGAPNDFLGVSVALSGDGSVAVAGAYGARSARGAVYVFVNTGNGWKQQARLAASDAAVGDVFGIALAIQGSATAGFQLIVGASGKEVSNVPGAGAVYTFASSGSAGWQQQQILTMPSQASLETNSSYGAAVAIDGAQAVVGAFGANAPGPAGAAFLVAGL